MKKAFSLAELLVALIIMSLLFSAFIPLMTKKLKASDITVGSFNNNEGQVITCKDGYHELNNKCALDIENCLSYDNLNKCIVCKAGYVLSNSVCYGEISNCKTQSGNTCSACNTGYVLQNNACYSAISNCKTQTGNTCSACNSGYVLQSNKCYAAISNCKTQSANTCSACNTGYTLSNNACYSTISNCKTQTGNTCSACNTGYVLQSNKCYASIPNCVTQSANLCTSCNTGYVLSNNACYVAIANCKTQSATTCSACNTGYVLSNNACYSSISNCVTQSANKCTVCNTGYTLTSSGTCTLACNCPNGTCASGTTYCTSCNSGYFLLNKSCLDCEPSNGFVKVGTNLCVMQYNIGDGKYGESWTGVQKCIAGNACTVTNGNSSTATTSNLTPTCWQGATSNTSRGCSADYGGYSGCNRTVCNYAGGYKLCANIGWRLPTLAELETFANTTYSNKTLASNGLMFCDGAVTSSMAPTCNWVPSGCIGTYDNGCYPAHLLTSTITGTYTIYGRYLSEGTTWRNALHYFGHSHSVRCVKTL